MPYILESRAVVWHVPKSAGTWLRQALTESGVDIDNDKCHDWPARYPDWDKYDFHAVLKRDPVDWYLSAWRFLRNTPRISATNAVGRLFRSVDDETLINGEFERFVLKHAGTYKRIIRRYSPPDCVYLKTETLAADAVTWLKTIGIKFDQQKLCNHPIHNRTKEPAPEINDGLAKLIREREL